MNAHHHEYTAQTRLLEISSPEFTSKCVESLDFFQEIISLKRLLSCDAVQNRTDSQLNTIYITHTGNIDNKSSSGLQQIMYVSDLLCVMGRVFVYHERDTKKKQVYFGYVDKFPSLTFDTRRHNVGNHS